MGYDAVVVDRWGNNRWAPSKVCKCRLWKTMQQSFEKTSHFLISVMKGSQIWKCRRCLMLSSTEHTTGWMGTVRNVITTGTHCPILAGSMSVPIFFHMISSVASDQVTHVPSDQQAGPSHITGPWSRCRTWPRPPCPPGSWSGRGWTRRCSPAGSPRRSSEKDINKDDTWFHILIGLFRRCGLRGLLSKSYCFLFPTNPIHHVRLQIDTDDFRFPETAFPNSPKTKILMNCLISHGHANSRIRLIIISCCFIEHGNENSSNDTQGSLLMIGQKYVQAQVHIAMIEDMARCRELGWKVGPRLRDSSQQPQAEAVSNSRNKIQ